MSSGTAALLVLTSAALHAAWNVALRRERDTSAGAIAIIAGNGVLSLVLALVLPGPIGGMDAATIRYGLGAGLFEGIYFLALARALAIGPIGTVYAVARGLPTLLIWPISLVFLGEPIGSHPVLAVVVLLLGLLALVPRGDPSPRAFAGYGWAVVTALGIVGAQVIYKLAIRDGAKPLALDAAAMAVALVMALLGVRQPWIRVAAVVRVAAFRLSAAAAASCLSFLLILIALRGEGAAWVLTLRNSSIAFAQLLGWVVLGERPTPRAFIGVGLIFAGVLWLGFG